MEVSLNSKETQYKKPNAGAIIGGTVAGLAVNNAVASTKTKLNQKIYTNIMFKMKKVSSYLSKDEYKQTEDAIANTLQKTGLKEKGVNIFKVTFLNWVESNNILKKSYSDKCLKRLSKKNIDKLNKKISDITSEILLGFNAYYHPKSKNILIPNRDLILAVFHEIGHAMNHNMSISGKILQKLRLLSLLSIPIGAIALLKTKKGENEKPKNNIDKTTTFIKNNAGKLTFATSIPILLEEGLATIKGNKFAKELLSPELAKKVAKTNALGYSTYVLRAVLSGVGISLGVKLKDAIAKPKPIQENHKNYIEKK